MAIFIIVMIILLKFCSKIFTKILLKFKWFKDAVPYINKGFLPSGYYIKFTKVPEQKYLEIPLFKNVKLEYRAKGSFSDNLIRVEVKEHPFSEVAHSVGTLRRLKKLDKLNIKKKKAARAKLKLKKNIWLWYARFYFKEIPTSGCLEVSFE